MAGESKSGKRFQVSPIDRFGRAIDPVVLDAAVQIGPRAMAHAEKLLADPAIAANLLEECAAAVSRVLQKPRPDTDHPIRDLQAYLFRAFLRRVNRTKRRMPSLANPTNTSEADFGAAQNFEEKILVDELLTRCDPVTRDMFIRRNQGFSWKEIGEIYSISAHAAESRFSQALQRVRRKLGLGS
ncbi:MAG TPA: sigma-70 family RNA polymerase sigma factor [Terriglobales bacterium]|jgi:DNA-directed RNA polymerase specialized sigma24 family protein|nr:sigma-70 family RNA polymerase sigma factor [Terriglobales bacterium]